MTLIRLSAFVSRYASESLYLRKKSLILAALASSFCLISLAFAILMAATEAMLVAAVFIVLALLCAAVLALLRGGKYYAASSLFLYGVFAAMFVAIKFDQYVNVYETYVFGTLGCFLLIVAALVADKPSQAAVIGVLDLAAIEALYWLDSYPKDGSVTKLAVQNLATSSLMVALGAVVAAYLVGMTTRLIEKSEVEAERARRSYEELGSAMAEAQLGSQRIGESLSSSLARSVAAIEALSAEVSGIARGMDELDEALGRSGSATRRAEAGQAEVKAALARYSEQVSRASAAIEEMAAAAASLGKQAAGKREAVRALVETSRSGEGVLASMGEAISRIQGSAKRVAELSAIIGDVADRTNLLGMNAAIEAAHAGQAGKGFAVVASEIRSLSVETSKSALVIAETLKEVERAVSKASESSEAASGAFRSIEREVSGVSLMIDELLASVQELSAGSSDVIAAVEAVAELTRSTESAVDGSSAGVSESLAGMESVASVASRVRSDTAVMSGRFAQMRDGSEEMKALGGENLLTIQALRSRLEESAGAGGEEASAPKPERRRGADRRRGIFSRGIRIKRPAV